MSKTDSQPKVSTIIPVYNGSLYLAQAIESVLSQTYTNYEIIVVDDGSTDDSYSVIQQYLPQVRYVEQSNQGVAAARNHGLKLAQGEFIAFLDQDDFFLPDKFSTQVNCLMEHPELAFVSSGWAIVNAQGATVGAVQPWLSLAKLDLPAILVWKPVFLGAMLFRRSFLELVEGFDRSLSQTPDVDLVLRLALKGGYGDWVRQVTVGYRQHERNASLDSLQQAQELELILDRFFAQPLLPSHIQILADESRYQSYLWSAFRLYHHGDLAKMADYLAKSFSFKRAAPTEIVFNWLEMFQSYAQEYGADFDVYSLSNSQEWKQLIEQCIIKPNF